MDRSGAEKVIHIISLHERNFLFLIGAFLALIALEFFVHVAEVGEVRKEHVVRVMRATIRTHARDFFVIESLISLHNQLWLMLRGLFPLYPNHRPKTNDSCPVARIRASSCVENFSSIHTCYQTFAFRLHAIAHGK